ncbi:MAG: Lar family restriction alleviation protein [Verrucomicrobia bacterium]|nr:Lar family restriction alleviation protein [Verrucomicrobiota bacterium]
MMETIQLEQCPFCGQTLLELRDLNGLQYPEVLPVPSENSPIFYWVHCRSCNAGGPVGGSKREARLLWNRSALRVATPQQAQVTRG